MTMLLTEPYRIISVDPLTVKTTFTFPSHFHGHRYPQKGFTCSLGWTFFVRSSETAGDRREIKVDIGYITPDSADFQGYVLSISGRMAVSPTHAYCLGPTTVATPRPKMFVAARIDPRKMLVRPDANLVFEFTVSFLRASVASPTARAVSPAKASNVFHDAITSGDLFDVTFYLYSRRLYGGRVGKRRALFGSKRALLNVTDSLDRLVANLAVVIIENTVDETDNAFPLDEVTEEYGYGDDSDLDDELEQGDGCSMEHPDSDSPRPRRMGHACVLSHVSYRTWKCLLLYLYTGRLCFSILNSARETRKHESDDFPTCSPKSMYRLANMINYERLKQLSLANLRSQISVRNVYEEVFSDFTSQFPDVFEMERQIIHTLWFDPMAHETIQEQFAKGELHRGHPAFKIIIDGIGQNLVGCPSPPGPSSPENRPVEWDARSLYKEYQSPVISSNSRPAWRRSI
ncbi:uncharacterized protein BT62DRAFT_997009 [Guyanagaster necrorhizus]|uniref:MATH domain-containing protein n=1 Tax=Guyanagaster necrorhizus TaxID=856835 RepID=A0A9P7VJN3_9AGAR|nr:uncharacterized protein BT62DRAFT_997009 [Guyanagaster necrorhizus MCA 3950]KAG7441717.1 hypothetical protein BT62DRAFT_997009 [Guyanagaster necrorhizus MCA 3950]